MPEKRGVDRGKGGWQPARSIQRRRRTRRPTPSNGHIPPRRRHCSCQQERRCFSCVESRKPCKPSTTRARLQTPAGGRGQHHYGPSRRPRRDRASSPTFGPSWHRDGDHAGGGAMSSMPSAPATIPATSEVTFSPAFAPLSVGNVSRSWASSSSPAARASAGPAPPQALGWFQRAIQAWFSTEMASSQSSMKAAGSEPGVRRKVSRSSARRWAVRRNSMTWWS